MKQPVRAATGLNIMHIEALHKAVELAWLCLGSWLHSCEPSVYLKKGSTLSDRVWVTIDIVCVWDINGVLSEVF